MTKFGALPSTTELDLTCKVSRSAVQSISSGASTPVNWDTEIFDPAGMHDNVTNNTRITVPVAGKYLVSTRIGWGAASNSGYIRSAAILTGGVLLGQDNSHPAGSFYGPWSNVVLIVDLNAGNYLNVSVLQDSGIALDVARDGLTSPFFEVARISY